MPAADPPRRRQPRPPTPERLHARALHYLQRFATTTAHLRRVLLRRALRDAQALGLEPGPVRANVDAVVAKVTAAGLVDDRLFALGRARRLAESGRSPARIRAVLAAKGLSEAVIAEVQRALEEERADPELVAAIAYARRRRLGPWRPLEARAAHRTKDLAALGRAGFGYGSARTVVDAADVDALEKA